MYIFVDMDTRKNLVKYAKTNYDAVLRLCVKEKKKEKKRKKEKKIHPFEFRYSSFITASFCPICVVCVYVLL